VPRTLSLVGCAALWASSLGAQADSLYGAWCARCHGADAHGTPAPSARLSVPPADLASLLGDQDWFSPAAAVVLLVASFERSAWKYPHPGAFRVVLLEAGHIAQNLLLAATHHGLAAAPTCALSDRAIESLLGLDRVKHAALHAVVLGVRGAQPSSADLGEVRWNPRFI